ncbi:hypothetical protein PVK06_042975 [Gossypium arboreum]|uniref:Uncharacterized protein n=1 Tax=Gossypium arboreum TaxID=29729 RepID=A0ABR0MMA9_GOSAR|nr:hypothetical protein PVK06_042975 [Gossypium arboreum]
MINHHKFLHISTCIMTRDMFLVCMFTQYNEYRYVFVGCKRRESVQDHAKTSIKKQMGIENDRGGIVLETLSHCWGVNKDDRDELKGQELGEEMAQQPPNLCLMQICKLLH